MLGMSIKNFNKLATVTWIQEFYNEGILDDTNSIIQNTYIGLPLQYPEDPTNPYSPSDWTLIIKDPIPETVQGATQTYTLKYYYSTSPILYTLPGIYHNPTLGLISYSSDGSTWYTIADKNLGAGSVRGNGYMYQFGNNNGWMSKPSNITSTKVDPTGYGPGNYYDADLFVTSGTRYQGWASASNANLWGNTTGTDAARQGPCPSGYHIWTRNEFNTIANIVIAIVGSNEADNCKGAFLAPSQYKYIYNRDGSVSSTHPSWRTCEGNASDRYNYYVELYTTPSRIDYNGSSYGYQIRPMKNTPVQPNTDWTILYKNW